MITVEMETSVDKRQIEQMKKEAQQKRKQAQREIDKANKRLKRLEESELGKKSEAYQAYKGVRFSIKGKNSEEVTETLAMVQRFLYDYDSTLTAIKKHIRRVYEINMRAQGKAGQKGISYIDMADINMAALMRSREGIKERVNNILRSRGYDALSGKAKYASLWNVVTNAIEAMPSSSALAAVDSFLESTAFKVADYIMEATALEMTAKELEAGIASYLSK